LNGSRANLASSKAFSSAFSSALRTANGFSPGLGFREPRKERMYRFISARDIFVPVGITGGCHANSKLEMKNEKLPDFYRANFCRERTQGTHRESVRSLRSLRLSAEARFCEAKADSFAAIIFGCGLAAL
jgi:hypothetical protein